MNTSPKTPDLDQASELVDSGRRGFLRFGFATAVSSTLAACGGGGDDGVEVAGSQEFALDGVVGEVEVATGEGVDTAIERGVTTAGVDGQSKRSDRIVCTPNPKMRPNETRSIHVGCRHKDGRYTAHRRILKCHRDGSVTPEPVVETDTTAPVLLNMTGFSFDIFRTPMVTGVVNFDDDIATATIESVTAGIVYRGEFTTTINGKSVSIAGNYTGTGEYTTTLTVTNKAGLTSSHVIRVDYV